MKCRKRPIELQFFRYGIDCRPDWFCDKVSTNEIITFGSHCEIKTLEGVMRGQHGDYILQGVEGEIYPVKKAIFEKTYDVVREG